MAAARRVHLVDADDADGALAPARSSNARSRREHLVVVPPGVVDGPRVVQGFEEEADARSHLAQAAACRRYSRRSPTVAVSRPAQAIVSTQLRPLDLPELRELGLQAAVPAG